AARRRSETTQRAATRLRETSRSSGPANPWPRKGTAYAAPRSGKAPAPGPARLVRSNQWAESSSKAVEPNQIEFTAFIIIRSGKLLKPLATIAVWSLRSRGGEAAKNHE